MELVILLGALAYTTNTMGYQKGLQEGLAAGGGGGGGGSITSAEFIQITLGQPPRVTKTFQLRVVCTKNFNIFNIKNPILPETTGLYYNNLVYEVDVTSTIPEKYGVFSKTYTSDGLGGPLPQTVPTGYDSLAYVIVGQGIPMESGPNGNGAIHSGVLDITGYSSVEVTGDFTNQASKGEDTVLNIIGGTSSGPYTAGGGISSAPYGANNNVTEASIRNNIYSKYGYAGPGLLADGGAGFYSLTFFNKNGGIYESDPARSYSTNVTLILATIEAVPTYTFITSPSSFT